MGQLRADGRVLHVDLQGETIRARTGSMVAYEGKVDFKSAGMGGGGGFRAALKQRVAGEGLSLMEVSGAGHVMLAEDGQYVTRVELNNETLTVEADSLLALTQGLQTDVKFIGLQNLSNGQGVATTVVCGSGEVALLSDGPMIALGVQGDEVFVDPQAYVASQGNLQMNLISGVSWRTFVGEGNGEAFTQRFTGQGVVFLQPAERGA